VSWTDRSWQPSWLRLRDEEAHEGGDRQDLARQPDHAVVRHPRRLGTPAPPGIGPDHRHRGRRRTYPATRSGGLQLVQGRRGRLDPARDLAGHSVAVNTCRSRSTRCPRPWSAAGSTPSGWPSPRRPSPKHRAHVSWPRRSRRRTRSRPWRRTSPRQGSPGRTPGLVERFTAAVDESLGYTSAHPDEARQALTTYTKISGDVLKNLALPSRPPRVDMAPPAEAGLTERAGRPLQRQEARSGRPVP